jgi:phosphoglycolate phosphatase
MFSDERLMILDADGTTINAFEAIDKTFAHHGMEIGDLERFQKRRHLFKYLGGLKELPTNFKRQLGKKWRSQLIDTLTEVYREEARLYPGIEALIERLMAASDIRVGLVTRNITNEPEETLRRLFLRHGVDLAALDFLVHIPLGDEKTSHFRAARERYMVNPARSYACGDERKDFVAAVGSGMHPFMVSYGFEDFERLTTKIGVPAEIISRTPEELCRRVSHALELGIMEACA